MAIKKALQRPRKSSASEPGRAPTCATDTGTTGS